MKRPMEEEIQDLLVSMSQMKEVRKRQERSRIKGHMMRAHQSQWPLAHMTKVLELEEEAMKRQMMMFHIKDLTKKPMKVVEETPGLG